MHPGCLECLCETGRHLVAALFEVWCLFLWVFFLRWSNLGCPGEGFCNSWLPTSNIYGQPDAKAFAKGVGQAEWCCAGAVRAAGAQCWAGGTQFSLSGGFLSGGSVFLLFCLPGVLLTKDRFLQLVRDPSGVPHFVGWLAENGGFSHKSWSFQEGDV